MAMEYDALLAAHLAESPSARAERTVGAVDLVDLLSTERARFKAQAVAQCVRAANVPPVKNLKTAKPFTKPDAKRWWQPMKEYLTKLAADKAASDDQTKASSPNRGRKRPDGRKPSRPPSRRRRSPAKDARQKNIRKISEKYHENRQLSVEKARRPSVWIKYRENIARLALAVK